MGFHKGPYAPEWKLSSNADLWSLLWLALARKPLMRVYWVKSHVLETPKFLDKYNVTLTHVVGNAVADHLADLAAERAAVPRDIAGVVLQWFSETVAIQKRILYLVDRDITPR